MAEFIGWKSPGYSNPNLLVNGNMRHPVNRRGQMKWISETYSSGKLFDCWKNASKNTTIEIKDNYVFLSINMDGGFGLVQGLDPIFIKTLAGKDVILSAKMKCTKGKGNFLIVQSDNKEERIWSEEILAGMEGIFTVSGKIIDNPAKVEFALRCVNNQTEAWEIELEAVKLELGTVSTLAADIINPIPYEYELLRCLQYDLEGNYIAAVPASNPNLLVNWDFRQPVNQRGQNSYTGFGYGLDMWIQGNTTVTIKSDYISTTLNTDHAAENYMHQIVENTQPDKIYTLSVALKDGKYYIATGKPSDIVSLYFADGNAISMIEENGIIRAGIAFYKVPVNITAVKLEVGTVSTLAQDLMQPSDYEAELRKCQRYLVSLNSNKVSYATTGVAITGRNGREAYTFVTLPTEMRIKPTVSYFGSWSLYPPLSEGAIKVTGMSANRMNGTLLKIYLVPEAQLTNDVYRLDSSNDFVSNILISAEL